MFTPYLDYNKQQKKCIQIANKMYKLYQKKLHYTLPTLPINIKPPIANIKTSKEVEPAEINGSGSPVGGIEPLNISYCTMNFCNKKRANSGVLPKFNAVFLYIH